MKDDEYQLRQEFGWQHNGNGGVYAPVDKSNNKALPWIGALLAGFAAGGVLVICLLRPWDDAAGRVKAELRAEFADRFARVEKNAGDAATVSEIWRNRVNKLEAEANANRR